MLSGARKLKLLLEAAKEVKIQAPSRDSSDSFCNNIMDYKDKPQHMHRHIILPEQTGGV